MNTKILDIKITPMADRARNPRSVFKGLVTRGRRRSRCFILDNIKLSSGLRCCQRVAVKRRDMLDVQIRGAEISAKISFGLGYI